MISEKHKVIITRLAALQRKEYTTKALATLVYDMFPEYRELGLGQLETLITQILYSQ